LTTKTARFALLMLSLFVFRVVYGLSMDFWKDDERQIYLLGLHWFTTGHWPFFGPDVVHTNQQIAGALQSILVGAPLFVAPWPESPVILVNILSFIGLWVLGAYLVRLLPMLPRSLVYAWLFTLPWTLNISTHVYNPSYLLFSSCLFFVAFWESMPTLRQGVMSDRWAFFWLGLALGWSLQLHLSWLLLVPFVAAACGAKVLYREMRWQLLVTLCIGFALPTLLLLPTLYEYGVSSVWAPLFSNSKLNSHNALQPLTIAARFLSFAAYELPRFLTEHSEQRLSYVMSHPWLIPAGIVVGLIGVVQPLIFVWGLCLRCTPPLVKAIVVASAVEICLAFIGSTRPPTARNYFILFPVAAIGGAYAMSFLLKTRRQRQVAAGVVLLGCIFQGLLAVDHIRERGLYSDRATAAEAITTKNDRLFGERRSFTLPDLTDKQAP